MGCSSSSVDDTISLKDREEAISALTYSLRLAPFDWRARPRLLSALGMVLREAGPERAEDAITVLHEAARANHEDPNVWWNLGTACYQARKSQDAVSAYMQACDVAPDSWEGIAPILNNLATVMLDRLPMEPDHGARGRILNAAIETLRESVRRELRESRVRGRV